MITGSAEGLPTSVGDFVLQPTSVRKRFAPGSGSSFALLPFEPGTGNFTKIVQRVGVRVRFDTGQRDVDRLRPGLSVTARVRLDG